MYKESAVGCLFLSILVLMAVCNSVISMSVMHLQTNRVHLSLNTSVFDISRAEKQTAGAANTQHDLKRSKRSYSYDFGLNRGYTGVLHGKHLMGMNAANDIYGPGR